MCNNGVSVVALDTDTSGGVIQTLNVAELSSD